MSAATTAGSVPPMAEPPPIAIVLSLLQSVLAGSSLFFRYGIRILLALVYPLRIVWPVLYALLSPVFTAVKIALDIVLFTPFSIIRMVAVALYPVYTFCVVACIVGATVGVFGHYISTAVLSALARSKYFARPPSLPPAARPSSAQATLRKRKRRTVRLQ